MAAQHVVETVIANNHFAECIVQVIPFSNAFDSVLEVIIKTATVPGSKL